MSDLCYHIYIKFYSIISSEADGKNKEKMYAYSSRFI
jgi:hypothetical protein